MSDLGVLTDQFGRIANDLRFSITDRCDLRCIYCMPAEGMEWLKRNELLTAVEIERLVRLFMSLGVRSVRVTGGEPLVRADIVDVIQRLASLGLSDLSMTTNGTRLARLAEPLVKAGLQRVNVSLDTLHDGRFTSITKRNSLGKVLSGLIAASKAGLSPIKVNCVIIAGVNDDEILDFARLARVTGYDVRFVEPMPLDGNRAWTPEMIVPSAEIIKRIETMYQLGSPEIDGPSVKYLFADEGPGSIGVVGCITEPFCDSCDRLRLTAEGMFRACLFTHDEIDLRTPMRSGATDIELADIVKKAVWNKQAGHGIGNVNFRPPDRSMSRIGG